MRTHASFRLKRRSFYRKSVLQMFLLIFGGHIGAPIWRLHTKLFKGAWNVSANNSETVVHKDLRLGQIVYILVFYNISFSWLLPLDGFQFIFLLRDSENDCDWTNEDSLAAVAASFRNSRQNRENVSQNTGARIQSFIVPSECGHRSHRSLDPVHLSALCAYAVFFFHRLS